MRTPGIPQNSRPQDGAFGALNIRILGFLKQVPVAPLHKFIPWGIGGFIVNIVTGLDYDESDRILRKANWNVKAAIVMQKTGLALPKALARLRRAHDSMREAIGEDIEPRLRGMLQGHAEASSYGPVEEPSSRQPRANGPWAMKSATCSACRMRTHPGPDCSTA